MFINSIQQITLMLSSLTQNKGKYSLLIQGNEGKETLTGEIEIKGKKIKIQLGTNDLAHPETIQKLKDEISSLA